MRSPTDFLLCFPRAVHHFLSRSLALPPVQHLSPRPSSPTPFHSFKATRSEINGTTIRHGTGSFSLPTFFNVQTHFRTAHCLTRPSTIYSTRAHRCSRPASIGPTRPARRPYQDCHPGLRLDLVCGSCALHLLVLDSAISPAHCPHQDRSYTISSLLFTPTIFLHVYVISSKPNNALALHSITCLLIRPHSCCLH